MLNVFAIAGRLTPIINPHNTIILKISDGVQVNADYSTTPKFIEIEIRAEIQAMSTSDLQQVENMNQQSDMRAVYIIGGIKALNRPLQYGGDILHFYGSDWLVTQQLEEWGDGSWTKVAVTRQINQPQDSQ